MRVAIVHEWFASYAGSEKVVEQMLHVYPQAELFAIVDFLPADQRAFLGGRTVRTSFIQKLPLARRHFRRYLGLMPLAIEQFDVSEYDLVISSSHAVAKGVLTNPHQLHVCMCYSPMRYAWHFQEQYLRSAGLAHGLKSWLVRRTLHRLRNWDVRTANGVDVFLAVSAYIAGRIWKVYRRQATVIYPPVDVAAFTLRREKEDFYLAASRLTPYKRMDLIVRAFAQMPGRKLVVIGAGPMLKKLRRLATPNVTIMGYQGDDVLVDHYRRARAFVFAAEEDFGIVPVEAQACGTPVIAFSRGGAGETVIDGVTGIFFDEQKPQSLIDAVERFESAGDAFDPDRLRENAERFSIEHFRDNFERIISREYSTFRSGGSGDQPKIVT